MEIAYITLTQLLNLDKIEEDTVQLERLSVEIYVKKCQT